MIYDISPVNNYRGNNNSTTFDFDFYIDNENQLKVYLYDKDSVKFELKNNIDYLIEGIQSENGGYITFPIEGSEYEILSEEQKISLELELPVSQETQYNNSSLLNLEALEYSFDYLTRLIQILKRKIALCVKVEECSENSPQELINMINEASVSAQLNVNQINIFKNEVKELSKLNSERYDDIVKIVDSVDAFKTDLIKSGMFKFCLFDTKISDHILEGNEAKGWALQGTYVAKDLYPDFYNKCLEQKNTAAETETTLGSSTLTMFVNSNGHQFYNISDKSIVDDFYNTFGIADFYGIDEENERIFLPRNKYFHQLTADVSRVNEFVEAGLPDHLHYIGKWSGEKAGGGFTDNGPQNYGLGGSISSSLASISNSIYGNSNTVQPPSSLKLLYYCVGNTVVNDAEIDAGGLVTQVETKANIFLDNVLPTQEFKTQSVSWSMPSGRYIDLTLGASGSTYTAPANGWFYLNKVAGSDWHYCEFTCAVEGSYDSLPCWGSDYKTSPIKIWTPVKKGAIIKVNYNATGKTNDFKFIYAEGEQ